MTQYVLYDSMYNKFFEKHAVKTFVFESRQEAERAAQMHAGKYNYGVYELKLVSSVEVDIVRHDS